MAPGTVLQVTAVLLESTTEAVTVEGAVDDDGRRTRPDPPESPHPDSVRVSMAHVAMAPIREMSRCQLVFSVLEVLMAFSSFCDDVTSRDG